MKFTCLELDESRQMKQEIVVQKMNVTKQRYLELENNPTLKKERAYEILKVLGCTSESARRYLDAIPIPSVH